MEFTHGVSNLIFSKYFLLQQSYRCLSVFLINTKCDGNHRYNLDNLMTKTAIHSTSLTS